MQWDFQCVVEEVTSVFGWSKFSFLESRVESSPSKVTVLTSSRTPHSRQSHPQKPFTVDGVGVSDLPDGRTKESETTPYSYSVSSSTDLGTLLKRCIVLVYTVRDRVRMGQLTPTVRSSTPSVGYWCPSSTPWVPSTETVDTVGDLLLSLTDGAPTNYLFILTNRLCDNEPKDNEYGPTERVTRPYTIMYYTLSTPPF